MFSPVSEAVQNVVSTSTVYRTSETRENLVRAKPRQEARVRGGAVRVGVSVGDVRRVVVYGNLKSLKNCKAATHDLYT